MLVSLSYDIVYQALHKKLKYSNTTPVAFLITFITLQFVRSGPSFDSQWNNKLKEWLFLYKQIINQQTQEALCRHTRVKVGIIE